METISRWIKFYMYVKHYKFELNIIRDTEILAYTQYNSN